MRIIALSNTILFKNAVSGGDVVFPQINRFLEHNKFKVSVVTTKVGKNLWEGLNSEAKIYIIADTFFDDWELFTFVPLLYIARTFFVIRKLNQLLKDGQEDILIYTCSDFFTDVIPAFLARKTNRKIRWIARIYHIVKPPHKRKGNVIFNIISFLSQRFSFFLISIGADLVVTLSGTIKDLRQMLFKKTKIMLNDPGLDLEAIESAKECSRKFDAVYVGGLIPTKGIYELLEIWHRVTREIKQAKLAIIGGGSKRDIQVYAEKIKKYNIKDNVEYLGFLPKNEDVYSVLKSSKVFVYTGHENGWCLPASEAFACRVPCVAYKLKLFGTAFHKGFITVDLYDFDAFAKEVVGLLEDEEKWQRLSQEAYEEARRLDWRNVAREFSAIASSVF